MTCPAANFARKVRSIRTAHDEDPDQPSHALDLAEQVARHFEGLYLKAYRCPAGVLTIGYGHTGPDVTEGRVITATMAEELLAHDLAEAALAVDHLVKAKITEAQHAALTDFVFNLGRGALAGSTLLARLNDGDLPRAGAEFLKWDKAHIDGQLTTLPGLTKRRAWAVQVFFCKFAQKTT